MTRIQVDFNRLQARGQVIWAVRDNIDGPVSLNDTVICWDDDDPDDIIEIFGRVAILTSDGLVYIHLDRTDR